MKPVRAPHVGRLLQRARSLDAPVVQLWGWPGCGQQAVLDALVAEGQRVAQPLSLEDVAEEGSLRRAVEGAVAGGARWLVLPAVPAPPRTAAADIAGLLPAGRRLLFAAPKRAADAPLAVAYVGPREHLLTADEAAALWQAATGRVPAPALLEALMSATDGWLRPLLLLAEEAAEGGGLEDGALATLPGAESFLRYEVLAGLSAAERALAGRLALAGSADPELWRGLLDAGEQVALEGLRETWGLVIEVADGDPRLPAPLAALLAGPAGHEPGAARLAVTLAAAERRRGRPLPAFRLLIAADEAGANPAPELSGLMAGEWVALLAEAPLEALGRAAVKLPAPAPSGAELIRRLSAVLLARSPASAEAASRLALWAEAEAPAAPAVAAAARLAASLLAPSSAGVEPPGDRAPQTLLPPPLAPLASLAAALPRAAVAPDGGDGVNGEDDGARSEAEVVAREVAAALAALPDPAGPPDLVSAGGVGRLAAPRLAAAASDPAAGRDFDAVADPRSPAVTALAEHALQLLLAGRPELDRALRRRRELPAAWRDRLGPPPPSPLGRGYELELLGEGRVTRREEAGERELAWPLKRALKALAYLATSPGRRAGRGELEEALWPGADETRLRRNFHPTLSHLRRSLEEGLERPWEPPLLLESGVYRLNPALGWRLDTDELERLLAAGQAALERERVARAAALWERAHRLYRGPFLAGWEDPWIVARRERWQRLWLELLRGLGEVYARVGRIEEAIDMLRTVLIHDSLQERVHRSLMQAYGRQGRRDLVHRQYERLVEQLSRELGEEPMAATTETYQRLMA